MSEIATSADSPLRPLSGFSTPPAADQVSLEALIGDGESSEQGVDHPDLESDIQVLDNLLDATILRLEGEDALRLVEEIRAATQELRSNPSLEPARKLRDRLSSLDLSKLRTLTRASVSISI